MTEDEVIDKAVAHYVNKGCLCLYRTARATAAGGPGEQGGADAILHDSQAKRFFFLEAKGSADSPVKASNNFTNALGAVIKRVRLNAGYTGNEALINFDGNTDAEKKETRNLIQRDGILTNSAYILALPNEYGERARSSVDEEALKLLHIGFLWVEGLA
jgi:hypothetical protein